MGEILIFGCQKMQGAFPNGFGEILMPFIYMIFKGLSNIHKQYLNIIFSPFKNRITKITRKRSQNANAPQTAFLEKFAPEMVSVKIRCYSNKYPRGSKL